MLLRGAILVFALGTLCSAKPSSNKHILKKRQDLLDSVNSILYDAANTSANCVLAPLNTVITVAINEGSSCDSLAGNLNNVVSDSNVEDSISKPLSSFFNCVFKDEENDEALDYLKSAISGVNYCVKKGTEHLNRVNTLCSNLVQNASSCAAKCGKISDVPTVTGVCGNSLSSSSSGTSFDSDNLLGDISQILENTISDLTGSDFSNIFGNLYDLVEAVIENLVSCNDVFKSLSSDINNAISQVESSSNFAVSEVCPLLKSLLNDLEGTDSSTSILNDINSLAGKIISSTTCSSSESVEEIGSLISKILQIISNKSSSCSAESSSSALGCSSTNMVTHSRTMYTTSSLVSTDISKISSIPEGGKDISTTTFNSSSCL